MLESYRKGLVIAAVLTAGVILSDRTMAASDVRPIPPADTEFLDEHGRLRKGVRCASPFVNPAKAYKAGLSTGTESGPEAALLEPAVSIEIPVAFHVIYAERRGRIEGDVSDAQIDAQIEVLNDAWAGLGFSFFVRAGDIDRTNNRNWFTGCYNPATESEMKQALAVDPATTLNIYTCKPGQGILGYAYLPQSIDEKSFLHGVVALYSSLPGGTAVPYDEGDTITHEVGHYLGLYHTFQGGCTGGDAVNDTAPEASPAFGCPDGRDTCAGGGPDPIYNFMDYSDDDCMEEFTDLQGDRMVAQTAIYKPSLGDPAAPLPVCGDGACDAGEDMCNCPGDCGVPPLIESSCTNGFDDNCDGDVDCDDAYCAADPACVTPTPIPTCSSSGEPCDLNGDCCSDKCKGHAGRRTCR